MMWFVSSVSSTVMSALQQFSWGLLEAYGCDAEADGRASDEAADVRTPEERDANFVMLASHFPF